MRSADRHQLSAAHLGKAGQSSQEFNGQPIGSTLILNAGAATVEQTPFDKTPVRRYQDGADGLTSQEKLRAPPHSDQDYLSTQQHQPFAQQQQESASTAKANDKAYWSHQQVSYHQKYRDLRVKGCVINKERDSHLLRSSKEPDAVRDSFNAILINNSGRQGDSDNAGGLFQRPSITEMSESDVDEMPPLSPLNRNIHGGRGGVGGGVLSSSRDHRFSVRQIQFNLISSLVATPNRTSFISRASNKLNSNKNNSSSQQSSNLTRRQPSHCGRCSSSKGLFFYCCGAGGYNPSSRSKNDNSSIYSSNNNPQQPPFSKVVVYHSADSFVIQCQQKPQQLQQQPINRNSYSLYLKTEDFSDEVDEYENDAQGHRLSIVKRLNINSNLFSPGSRIAFQSVVVPESNSQNQNFRQREQRQDLDENKPVRQSQLQQPSSQVKPALKLDQYVTKVPQNQPLPIPASDIQSVQINLNSSTTQPNQPMQNTSQNNSSIQRASQDDSVTSSSGQPSPQDIHRLHFLQTIQALHNIKQNLTMPSEEEIQHLKVLLPPHNDPSKMKTVIFDMDETLIHCVDDIENEDPDVVIPIMFPDEDEPVNAGLNIRPYIYECLEEANKYFQVGVFTASHKAYADAILDFLDPENKYFQFRLYRDNCVQTKEGYYVKDLRILANRELQDIVIIDNSVYSFAFQIDNGIPIIPFYSDKEDEEMLHLIYYLNCLQIVEDVREQNKEAFELNKLSSQSPFEIINNYYSTNNQQQLLLQNEESLQQQHIQQPLQHFNDDVILEETYDECQQHSEEEQQHQAEEDNFEEELGNVATRRHGHVAKLEQQTTPQRLLKRDLF